MPAILGTTTDNHPLSIGDIERRNGLYILGKPRMGKSWLIAQLILQDIPDHGVFFLDPHGDAIDELLERVWDADRYVLLDPQEDKFTFGIDLLHCSNVNDQRLRNDTFTRAKGVFDKLWQNTFEEKPWLQLILQNTIYALIENQGYTLAELPMFFREREFRYFIASRIKYNLVVRDYWLKTFADTDKREQDSQMEAAQTRAEIMLGHPYVAHILGQTTTTLDFQKLMDDKQVVFLRLSTALSYESKKIIGTIILSELKHAIERRPPDKKAQFSIFIDEFQNFVSFEDMATLITQAPKFGISTTIAHHERFGQLEDDKKIIGATSTIANKFIFQITGKDAHDFAPEFREDPPEVRDGDIYTISQSPFYDLLQGHSNPYIREHVDSLLRPIKERAEDIYGDTETERLIRTGYLDEANLYRIDERIESAMTGDRWLQRGVLGSAAGQISKAKSQVEKLKELNHERILIRATIRLLNRLFIGVMEGTLKCDEDDAFSDLLIEISKAAIVPSEDRRILELYIALLYGAPNRERTLPFACAKRQGLFKEYVEKTERESNTEYETQRAAFARRVWEVDIEKLLQENVREYNKTRIEQREHEMTPHEINRERIRLKEMCSYAIEEYEKGQMPKGEICYGLTTLFYLLEEIGKYFKPLIKKQHSI